MQQQGFEVTHVYGLTETYGELRNMDKRERNFKEEEKAVWKGRCKGWKVEEGERERATQQSDKTS